MQAQQEDLVTREAAPDSARWCPRSHSQVSLGTRILVVAARPPRERSHIAGRICQIKVGGARHHQGSVTPRATEVEDAGNHLPLLPNRVRSRTRGDGDQGHVCGGHRREERAHRREGTLRRYFNVHVEKLLQSTSWTPGARRSSPSSRPAATPPSARWPLTSRSPSRAPCATWK